jgi:PAS domain S-box-containing protein
MPKTPPLESSALPEAATAIRPSMPEHQFFGAVMNGIADMIAVCDADGRLVFFNQAARSVHGELLNALSAADWSRSYGVLAGDGQRPLAPSEMPLVRALANPDVVHVVPFMLQAEDGERTSYVSHARAIRNKAGEVIGAVSTSRDVTLQMRAEEAKQQSDALYRASREAMLDAYFILEAVRDASGAVIDFLYVDVNERALLILRSSRADVIGLRISEVFPGVRATPNYTALIRVLATRVSEEEELRSTVLGENVWIRRLIVAYGDGIVVNARDVTATRLAEENEAARARAEASELQFRTMAEAIPQIVWTMNAEGAIEYYNQRWFDYTGAIADRRETWSWEHVLHPEDVALAAGRWTTSFATGEPYDVELRLRRASDDCFRWHLARALPVRDAAGRIMKWFGTCTDIHDQKEAQSELEARVQERTAELRAATDMAIAANRAKSEFLARMSHELRTPLNAVIGFASILERNKRGALAEKELLYAARIDRNGRHLLKLINDILDLSKVEAGYVRLEESTVRVDLLARDICDVLADRAAEAFIALDLVLEDVPEAGVAPMRSDETRLRQVLLNLIGNALKFTPKHGRVRVRVVTDPTSGRPLFLDVTDSGIGIPEDAQDRVFGAFEQADLDTSARFGGTGLGLPISRALCEAMGFGLTLSSRVGEGSTFAIRFDRGPAPAP